MPVLKKILLFLFRFFVKINFYYGIALILSILTKPLNTKRKYKVLSLIKPVFSNDLDEIKKVESDLQFLSFPRLLLSEIVKKYALDFSKLNDASYHPIMDGTKEQEKIYFVIKKVLKHLKRIIKFDAIFAGNYVYVSQQEFFKVAKEENIPVIILYKEGMFPAPISKEKSDNLYTGKKFVGDKFLVYNNIIKNILLNAKIPGIEKEIIEVVGVPRLDSYLENIAIQETKNTITLFTFEPHVKAQIALTENASDVDVFINKCEQFQKDLFLFCKNNSQFKLTIKVKTSTDAIADIKRILNIKSFNEVPDNITISTTISPKKLLQESEYITGYFSTTLLEAMLLNKYIITPSFTEMPNSKVIDYFTNFNNVVNYGNIYSDFEAIFNNKKKLLKANEQKRNDVLSNMFYSLDTKSSERVVNAIINEIT